MPKHKKADDVITCRDVSLPEEHMLRAAQTAIETNPANRPRVGMLAALLSDKEFEAVGHPAFLAMLTTKYWGTDGIKLTVSFMDNPTVACRNLILAHMNAWHEWANVEFVYTAAADGQVRVDRARREGYYSYLGTDVLHIPAGQRTMNLEAFTENTSDSEYRRVVRHETGHTLGCPHEHLRAQIIAKLDRQKTLDYFRKYQGWDANTTTQQVLTPISESSVMGTPNADETSIMCYQLPGSITTSGLPIAGGTDINDSDRAFIAKMYPLPNKPPVLAADMIRIDLVKKAVILPSGWTQSVAG